jgi:hypothetical protein
MRTVHPHFAMALKEIRTATTAACWLIGLALMVQVVAWSLAAFTEIRYTELRVDPAVSADDAPTVLTADDLKVKQIHSIGTDAEAAETADVNLQLSQRDRWLGSLTNFMAAFGTMGAIALLPLIGLGVVLAAGSATDGVEKTSGAFVWTVVLLALSLPWASMFEQVPLRGLFSNYATICEHVDAFRTASNAPEGAPLAETLRFYGQLGLLPIAALLGVTAIGLRFRAGVEAGLMPREDLRLDPELEREISKIKSSSLVGGGGRSAGALRGVLSTGSGGEPDPRKPAEPSARPLRQPTPGAPLSRPI